MLFPKVLNFVAGFNMIFSAHEVKGWHKCTFFVALGGFLWFWVTAHSELKWDLFCWHANRGCLIGNMGKCKFSDKWQKEREFEIWLKPVVGNNRETYATLIIRSLKMLVRHFGSVNWFILLSFVSSPPILNSLIELCCIGPPIGKTHHGVFTK